MINFKAFLAEAKMAPLYHATDTHGFKGIVEENALATTAGGGEHATRGNKPTVFFTRDFRHAKWYAGKRAYSWFVFEVDQLKLSHRYKIKPIHNWQETYYHTKAHNKKVKGELQRGDSQWGNEFEEVTDKPVTNFLSYVKAIHSTMTKDAVASIVGKAVMEKLDSYNIEWKVIKR